jgi:glycosyltransferase involved in cell wall biosynthesis
MEYNCDVRMHLSIGLVTSPINEASLTPVSNYLAVLSQFSDLCIITGNSGRVLFERDREKPNVSVHFVNYPIESNAVLKVFRYVYGQIRYSYHIFKHAKDAEKWIFFTGGERMVLPMIIVRLLKKPVLLYMPGSAVRDANFSKSSLSKLTEILSAITQNISDRIILYSPALISEWNLTPYRHKILIAGEHFLNFTTFTVTTPYKDRPFLIGYIGRLSGEKGVQHFVKTLPAILNNNQELRVLIGGDGQLKQEIEASLQERGIADRIDLAGWISHDALPNYLNQLRLLVLPSYTEGLPNIMLEAMACGTPVLATPVGAIPDVIRDGETGFIMEDNSPECIARNVMRALNDPDLEQVAKRGRMFVEGEYTFEKVVERWKGILTKI